MGQNWSKVVKIYAKFGFFPQIVRYNGTFPIFLEQVFDKNCALKRVFVKTEPHCIRTTDMDSLLKSRFESTNTNFEFIN